MDYKKQKGNISITKTVIIDRRGDRSLLGGNASRVTIIELNDPI